MNSYTTVSYHEALHLQKQNKHNEAIDLFESIIDNKGANIGLFIRLGELYEITQLKEKAINTYKRGISLAQEVNNKKAERFLSFMLLGLID